MSKNSVKRLETAVENFKAATKKLDGAVQVAKTAFKNFIEVHARLKESQNKGKKTDA